MARNGDPDKQSPRERQQLREQVQQMQHLREHHDEMWDLHRGGRGRDRGPHGQQRPRLSREEVARVALAIVDREGLEGFSMRKLGAELGVDPMAAYYYFPNKAAVLDGIVDAVEAEIPPLPADDAPWDVRLWEMVRAWRHALRAHPHALPVLSTHPSSSIASLQRGEAAAALLHDAGFAPKEAFQIMNCIMGYVVGVTLAEVGVQPGGVPDPPMEEVQAQIAQLPPDEFPVLMAAFLGGGGMQYDPFEDGLDLLITGLKVRHGILAHRTAS